MRITLAPLAITAVAGAVALSGCSLLGESVDDMQLALGECISDPAVAAEGETEIGALPVVDCATPHYGEVYFVEDQTDAEYPAVSMRDRAEEKCYNAFEPFMGISYEESQYYITSITPSARTWAAGDRQIACLVVGEQSDELTGSLQGAAA